MENFLKLSSIFLDSWIFCSCKRHKILREGLQLHLMAYGSVYLWGLERPLSVLQLSNLDCVHSLNPLSSTLPILRPTTFSRLISFLAATVKGNWKNEADRSLLTEFHPVTLQPIEINGIIRSLALLYCDRSNNLVIEYMKKTRHGLNGDIAIGTIRTILCGKVVHIHDTTCILYDP